MSEPILNHSMFKPVDINTFNPEPTEAPKAVDDIDLDYEFEMSEPMLKPGFFKETFTDKSTKATQTINIEPLWEMPE